MNNLSKNYINGQWVDWAGDTIDVHEGTRGEVIAKVPSSDRAAMEQAIDAADAAFDSWSETTLEQRIAVGMPEHVVGCRELVDIVSSVSGDHSGVEPVN